MSERSTKPLAQFLVPHITMHNALILVHRTDLGPFDSLRCTSTKPDFRKRSCGLRASPHRLLLSSVEASSCWQDGLMRIALHLFEGRAGNMVDHVVVEAIDHELLRQARDRSLAVPTPRRE
jgi:hypothetical protein